MAEAQHCYAKTGARFLAQDMRYSLLLSSLGCISIKNVNSSKTHKSASLLASQFSIGVILNKDERENLIRNFASTFLPSLSPAPILISSLLKKAR